MSTLYRLSSLVTKAVLLSGRLAPTLSKRVRMFQVASISCGYNYHVNRSVVLKYSWSVHASADTSYQLPLTGYHLPDTSYQHFRPAEICSYAVSYTAFTLLHWYIWTASCLHEAPVAHWWSMQNWLSEA